jgi:hypothetical protein
MTQNNVPETIRRAENEQLLFQMELSSKHNNLPHCRHTKTKRRNTTDNQIADTPTANVANTTDEPNA